MNPKTYSIEGATFDEIRDLIQKDAIQAEKIKLLESKMERLKERLQNWQKKATKYRRRCSVLEDWLDITKTRTQLLEHQLSFYCPNNAYLEQKGETDALPN